jgi:hypothetical protein
MGMDLLRLFADSKMKDLVMWELDSPILTQVESVWAKFDMVGPIGAGKEEPVRKSEYR